MLLLLLLLIFSINKKGREVVVTIEGKVSYVTDSIKANAANLRLKIRIFAAAYFHFTKASFSQFFSYCFIETFFIDRQNSFSSAKITSF